MRLASCVSLAFAIYDVGAALVFLSPTDHGCSFLFCSTIMEPFGSKGAVSYLTRSDELGVNGPRPLAVSPARTSDARSLERFSTDWDTRFSNWDSLLGCVSAGKPVRATGEKMPPLEASAA